MIHVSIIKTRFFCAALRTTDYNFMHSLSMGALLDLSDHNRSRYTCIRQYRLNAIRHSRLQNLHAAVTNYITASNSTFQSSVIIQIKHTSIFVRYYFLHWHYSFSRGIDRLIVDISRSHTIRHTHASVARAVSPLNKSDQLEADAANHTTQNKHKRRISMCSAGFEVTIAIIQVKQRQTYELDRIATGTGVQYCKMLYT